MSVVTLLSTCGQSVVTVCLTSGHCCAAGSSQARPHAVGGHEGEDLQERRHPQVRACQPAPHPEVAGRGGGPLCV